MELETGNGLGTPRWGSFECVWPHMDADLAMVGFPVNGIILPETWHDGSGNLLEAARRVLASASFASQRYPGALHARFRDEEARYSALIRLVLLWNGWDLDTASSPSRDWTAEFEALPSETLDRDAPPETLGVASTFSQMQRLLLLTTAFESVRGLMLAAAALLFDLFFRLRVSRTVAFASRCRRFYLTHGAHPPKVQLSWIEGLFTGRTFQPLATRS